MMPLDKYRNDLQTALRMHEVSGQKAGEVLAEVETHVTDTGEDPAVAFGAPREYAAQVASQLDPNDGRRSPAATVAGSVAVGGLTMLGLGFLLDGVSPEGPMVAFTMTDAIRPIVLLALITVAMSFLFGAGRAPSRRFKGVVGGCVLLAFIVSSIVINAFVDAKTPLFELPPWGAIALGSVLLLGTVGFLVRAVRYGRVIDPR